MDVSNDKDKSYDAHVGDDEDDTNAWDPLVLFVVGPRDHKVP